MVKFDNRLLKYSVMIIIIYFLVSKVPSEQLPGNNPFLLTGIISVVLYILDQPNILFENFEHKQSQPIQSVSNMVPQMSGLASNMVPNYNGLASNMIPNYNGLASNMIQPTQHNMTETDKNTLKSIVREVFNENKKEMIAITKPTTDQNKLVSQPTTTITVSDNVKEHFDLAPISAVSATPLPTTDEVKKEDKSKTVTEMASDVLANGLPTTAKIISDAIAATKAEKCDCEETANKAIVKFLQGRRLLDNNGMLHYADAYIGDMGYSQIKLDKYIPLGANGDGAYDTWELAQYNIINTDRWKPSAELIPHCKTDVPLEVQPMDSRAPINLMNFDYSRKVMPPSNINTKFITERLNL